VVIEHGSPLGLDGLCVLVMHACRLHVCLLHLNSMCLFHCMVLIVVVVMSPCGI